MVAPKKFKRVCVACGTQNPKITKEHFWPQWLIERTGTVKVRFTPEKRIHPKSLVVPLCEVCNQDFGRELESPVARIFGEVEGGRGLSDNDAELLIRWLWKFEGLSWSFANPERLYNEKYGCALRQRILQPIEESRSNLSLAVCLAAAINAEFGDAPMGLDSWTQASTIFVAGVFSRIALMVLEREFEQLVPSHFGIYRMANPNSPDRYAKLFYPPTAFKDCVQAVNVTHDIGLYLSHAHDLEARNRAART